MKRDVYDLVDEPTGDVYRNLLRAALEECTEFGLVHQRRARTREVERVLTLLQPFQLWVANSASWPGSELAPGHTAEVFRYRLKPEAVAVLSSAVAGLYGWTQMDRPEDLHILRADGTVWLGTIAHEHEGWLSLTPDERREFETSTPDLKLRRRLPN